jgi:Luciferase
VHIDAVTAARYRSESGEFAFKVGGREIGHLHGDHSAHFGFRKGLWTRGDLRF